MKKMNKEQELLKLAELRQSKVYKGYTSIANYANRAYECSYVSPYSKSAHNIDANVFVILQDWSSKKGLDPKGEAPNDNPCPQMVKYGYSPDVKTNINLIKYLKTYLGLELKDIYATNLFPYIKSGNMRGKISPKDMKMAAQEFTLPMIDIIRPKIAIALGLEVFNGLRQGLKLKKVYSKAEAVKNTFDYNGTKIFFQAHPSSSTTNVFIKKNWGKMKKHLKIEHCSICNCKLNRNGGYARQNIEGRSHATKHHYVAKRFFGDFPVFQTCPWGYKDQTAVYCYECHEEMLHNPVLLPEDINLFRKLVKQRGFSEEEKTESKKRLSDRIQLFHEAISLGLKELDKQA